MANTETVIVDIPSLREAIASFRQCSSVLGECVSALQANTSEIAAAAKSEASAIYQTKIQNLAKNVGNAQTALNTKVKDLEGLCDRSENAEKKAKNIAQTLESNFMV